MANLKYAMLKNSIVENIVVFNEPSQDTLDYFQELHEADTIILADENCFIGSEYDNGTFWSNKPYPSWTKDYQAKAWRAPVDCPVDGNPYYWDEETLSWKMADQSDLDRLANG